MAIAIRWDAACRFDGRTQTIQKKRAIGGRRFACEVWREIINHRVSFDMVDGFQFAVIPKPYIIWWFGRPAAPGATYRVKISVMLFDNIDKANIAAAKIVAAKRNDI